MSHVVIPVLSLLIAAFAVFVGPAITFYGLSRQMKLQAALSKQNLIGPMRQAWINSLRDLIAKFLSSTLHYHVSGYEDRTDVEYQELTLIRVKIELMLNLSERDHKLLADLLSDVENNINDTRDQRPFIAAHTALEVLARTVLKREWDRVRSDEAW